MNMEQPIRRRILAVLDYDNVPKNKRASYLAKVSGCSRSTAYLVLNERAQEDVKTVNDFHWLIRLADALSVDWQWIYSGLKGYELHRCAPHFIRVLRIHVQEIKGFPKDDTDRIMRLAAGQLAGQKKAQNLFNLAATGQISYQAAGRML
jgi:hypothetical protein